MGTIFSIMASTPCVHIAQKISDSQLKNVSDSAKLHGMHKPYECDFLINKRILAEKSSSLLKEE